MRFADIVGHEQQKQRLRQMVDADRIPHAILLEGPEGVGKFAMARALAQYIHCTNRTDGDSCGHCPACRQHEAFNHVDTIFTFPVVKERSDKPAVSSDYLPEFREFLGESPYMDYEQWLAKFDKLNAKPTIYVDEAAELIRALNYTAHSAKYKVVLFWLPERMQEATANKLLKLIEEPYADTLFIFTSDQPRLILPTIYSRLQRVQFTRLPLAQVQAAVQKTAGVDAQTAAQLAQLGEGSVNQALRARGASKEQAQYLQFFMELMRKAYGRRVADLKKWAVDVAALGRERNAQLYAYAARLIRENFILNLRVPQLNCLNPDEAAFSAKFSPFINERNVLQLIESIDDASADILANANAKVVNFDLAIRVILLLKR